MSALDFMLGMAGVPRETIAEIEKAAPSLAALIASVVASAFGIDVRLEHDLFSVGRDQQAAGFGGEPGDQARARTIGVHHPHLRRSAAAGDEVDLF